MSGCNISSSSRSLAIYLLCHKKIIVAKYSPSSEINLRKESAKESDVGGTAPAATATPKKHPRFSLHIEEKEGRGIWSSRIAFYMATIGAAVGFGNVWRFPSLCVDYGCGALFVPYLIALFVLGIPLAVMEIGFGQYFQTGDIGVF